MDELGDDYCIGFWHYGHKPMGPLPEIDRTEPCHICESCMETKIWKSK